MMALALVAACSWNAPGHNPYTGKVPAAVESYADIPADVRARLKARMEAHAYDDVAAITRDAIQGKHAYTDLRAMHFGAGTVCGKPDRSRWADAMVERGLVYCEAEHCLIVPTVCRNVSRVTRLATLAAPGAALALAGLDPVGTAADYAGPPLELAFEPPIAGLQPTTWTAAAAPNWDAILPSPHWYAPITSSTPVVPEPPTILLALAGIAWLVWKANKHTGNAARRTKRGTSKGTQCSTSTTADL